MFCVLSVPIEMDIESSSNDCEHVVAFAASVEEPSPCSIQLPSQQGPVTQSDSACKTLVSKIESPAEEKTSQTESMAEQDTECLQCTC